MAYGGYIYIYGELQVTCNFSFYNIILIQAINHLQCTLQLICA